MSPKRPSLSEAGRGVRKAILALAAGCLCSVTAHAAIVHVVTPSADSYVRSSDEKKSFGFESHIELRMKSGAWEGYLQFPLPQHAPFAEKVTLRLYGQLADPGAAKVLVRSAAPGTWGEFQLNWRTRPEHKETIGSFDVVGISGAWHDVDVTAFVRAEAVAGRSNATLVLVTGEESKNRITIFTRENAQKKPELVFSRQPMTARLSFLPAKATIPKGYLGDNGEAFGPHTNGFSYGWSTNNTEFVRDRNESRYTRDKNPPIKTPDRRYDFTAYMDSEKMAAPLTWEMALPNGDYKVRIVAGDSFKYDSIYGITAEGVTIIDGVPDTNKRWLDGTATVSVKDGRLTIGNTPSSTNNKLCFIEVTEIETLLTQSK